MPVSPGQRLGPMVRARTKKKEGKTVLDHEGGDRFYFKHLSPKARAKKRIRRKMQKKSRKR